MAPDPKKQEAALKKLRTVLEKNTRTFATKTKEAKKQLQKAAKGG